MGYLCIYGSNPRSLGVKEVFRQVRDDGIKTWLFRHFRVCPVVYCKQKWCRIFIYEPKKSDLSTGKNKIKEV